MESSIKGIDNPQYDEDKKQVGFHFPRHQYRMVAIIGGSMSASIVEHPRRRDVVVVADREPSEDEKRKAVFIEYRLQHDYIIGSVSKNLFQGSGIRTYEQFKSEYQLIKNKKSKLSSNLRKEIESVWVKLFGK